MANPLIHSKSSVKRWGGKVEDVVDIAMLHIAEDFRMKFVPTAQDYLQHIQVQAWFNNGVKVLDSQEAQDEVTKLLTKISQ